MNGIKKVNIYDVADCERAKAGKIYTSGCSLIQLSATNRSIKYLYESGEVSSRYAVIIPKNIDGYYLYIAIQNVADEYFEKYIETLNLPFENLKYLDLFIHVDITTQMHVVSMFKESEMSINSIQNKINELKQLKETMLDSMFI